MTWAAAPAATRKLIWPLNRLQTIIVAVVLFVIVLLILLMIFPVLSKGGPAWMIYAFHDAIVLPIKGRIFDRYAPVPQIAIYTLIVGALLTVFFRRYAVTVYDRALAFKLRIAPLRSVLVAWTARYPNDAPLLAALEARFRTLFADAVLTKAAPKAKAAHDIAALILSIPAQDKTLRRAISDIAIAARDAALCVHTGQTPPLVTDSALLDKNNPLSQHWTLIQTTDATPSQRLAAVDAAWVFAVSLDTSDQDLAMDAVLWIAIFAGMINNDAVVSRKIYERLAKEGFRRSLRNASTHTDGGPLLDPLAWRTDPGFVLADAIPGMGLSGKSVSQLHGTAVLDLAAGPLDEPQHQAKPQ